MGSLCQILNKRFYLGCLLNTLLPRYIISVVVPTTSMFVVRTALFLEIFWLQVNVKQLSSIARVKTVQVQDESIVAQLLPQRIQTLFFL